MTKILLVEDDKNLREIYGTRLYAEGYDIVSAGDGEEALAMAIKERPNLIISDIMMPKISGFDMLDILRSTTETRKIKVIMMTALSSEEQRQRGESLGADRYLIKSQVGIEDVVRTVHEVLEDGSNDSPETSDNEQTEPLPKPNRPPQPVQKHKEPAAQAPDATDPLTSQTNSQGLSSQYIKSADNSMPQPIAPFSSEHSSLGERVIQPPAKTEKDKVDMSAKIAAELSASEAMPQQLQDPEIPQAPPSPADELDELEKQAEALIKSQAEKAKAKSEETEADQPKSEEPKPDTDKESSSETKQPEVEKPEAQEQKSEAPEAVQLKTDAQTPEVDSPEPPKPVESIKPDDPDKPSPESPEPKVAIPNIVNPTKTDSDDKSKSDEASSIKLPPLPPVVPDK